MHLLNKTSFEAFSHSFDDYLNFPKMGEFKKLLFFSIFIDSNFALIKLYF